MPGLAVAHPSLLCREPATTEYGYWADTPAELEAYAQQVALETGLDAGELADALLSGDARRVAALDAAAGGYLGQMVPGPGGGVVFRAPEMRLVVADAAHPDVPADEATADRAVLAVRRVLEGDVPAAAGCAQHRVSPRPGPGRPSSPASRGADSEGATAQARGDRKGGARAEAGTCPGP